MNKKKKMIIDELVKRKYYWLSKVREAHLNGDSDKDEIYMYGAYVDVIKDIKDNSKQE